MKRILLLLAIPVICSAQYTIQQVPSSMLVNAGRGVWNQNDSLLSIMLKADRQFYVSPLYSNLSSPHFSNVKTAIESATPGTAIIILPGTYAIHGRITIPSDGIAIIGTSAGTYSPVTKTVSGGVQLTYCNLMLSSHGRLHLSGFTINNADTNLECITTSMSQGFRGNVIENVTFVMDSVGSNLHSIVAQSGSGWYFRDLKFYNLPSGSHGLAIRASNVIAKDLFFWNSHGGTDVIIKADHISGNAENVVIDGLVDKSTALNNGMPIVVQSIADTVIVRNVSISNCVWIGNRPPSWDPYIMSTQGGVKIEKVAGTLENVVISNVTVHKAYYTPFRVDSASFVTFVNCHSYGSQAGAAFENYGGTNCSILNGVSHGDYAGRTIGNWTLAHFTDRFTMTNTPLYISSDAKKDTAGVNQETVSDLRIVPITPGKDSTLGVSIGMYAPSAAGGTLWETARIWASPQNNTTNDATGKLVFQLRYYDSGWKWKNVLTLRGSDGQYSMTDLVGGGGTAAWGSISAGTGISSQTDLYDTLANRKNFTQVVKDSLEALKARALKNAGTRGKILWNRGDTTIAAVILSGAMFDTTTGTLTITGGGGGGGGTLDSIWSGGTYLIIERMTDSTYRIRLDSTKFRTQDTTMFPYTGDGTQWKVSWDHNQGKYVILHDSLGSGGSATWGAITGILSNQTDLDTLLDRLHLNVTNLYSATTDTDGVRMTNIQNLFSMWSDTNGTRRTLDQNLYSMFRDTNTTRVTNIQGLYSRTTDSTTQHRTNLTKLYGIGFTNANYLWKQDATGLAGWGQLSLSDLIDLTANKTFNLLDYSLTFQIAAPSSPGFDINITGNLAGDALHIHQHTGNPTNTSRAVRIETNDADIMPLSVQSANDTAAEFKGGKTYADSVHTLTLTINGKPFVLNGTPGSNTVLKWCGDHFEPRPDSVGTGGGGGGSGTLDSIWSGGMYMIIERLTDSTYRIRVDSTKWKELDTTNFQLARGNSGYVVTADNSNPGKFTITKIRSPYKRVMAGSATWGTLRYQSFPTQTMLTPSTQANTSGNFTAFPFEVPFTITIDTLRFEVSTAAAGGMVVGIYSNESDTVLYPATLMGGFCYDTCSVAVKRQTLPSGPITLYAGQVYWLAYSANNTSTMRAVPISGMKNFLGANPVMGTNNYYTAVRVARSFDWTLPSTAPSGAIPIANLISLQVLGRVR